MSPTDSHFWSPSKLYEYPHLKRLVDIIFEAAEGYRMAKNRVRPLRLPPNVSEAQAADAAKILAEIIGTYRQNVPTFMSLCCQEITEVCRAAEVALEYPKENKDPVAWPHVTLQLHINPNNKE